MWRRRWRMARYVTLRMLLLSVLVLTGTGWWLAGTESGARVAVPWISGLTPNVRMQYADGTLLGPLHLQALAIKTKTARIGIDDIHLDWSPGCLWLGEICLRDAKLSTLIIELPPSSTTPQKNKAAALPSLDLPLDIDIDHISLAAIEIVRDEKRTRYTELAASLRWQNQLLTINHLVVGMPSWAVTVTGTLNTRDDWPIDASAQLQTPRLKTPDKNASGFTLGGTISGSLRDTRLALVSTGPIAADIHATIATLQPGMPFSATLNAARVMVPPRAAPEKAAVIEQLQLTGQGELLGPITLTGRGRIDTPWTPPIPATVRASGTWRGIEQGEISIAEPKIAATIITDYDWLGTQQFRARVDVHKLDLALVNPAIPSQLAGTLHVDGTIEKGTTTVAVNVNTLSGTLRAWPFHMQGPLRWENTHWVFDNFILQQGKNIVRIKGVLAEQWQANAALELGDLQTLQPLFSGTALGAAKISGAPTDPDFTYTLNAANMQLPMVTLPALPNSAARTIRLPAADWQFNGRATLRGTQLQDAHTINSDFFVGAQGTIDWQDALRWDINSKLGNFPLHTLLPELGGRVGGSFAARGNLINKPDNKISNILETLTITTALTGSLDELPLQVNVDMDYTPERTEVRELKLLHGNNHLTLSGLLAPDSIALDIDADAPELATSLREFSGSTRVQARISGPRDAPDADITIAGQSLYWKKTGQTLGIGALSANLHLDEGARANSTLLLTANDLRIGDNKLALQSMQSLRFEIAGTRADHRLDFTTELIAGENPASAQLVIAGTFNESPNEPTATPLTAMWQGHLRDGNITANDWRFASVGEPALTFNRQILTVDAHCWRDQGARICLTAPAVLGQSGHIVGEAFHLPLANLLNRFLPADTVLTGRVGGTFSANWHDGKLDNFALDWRNADPLQLALANDTPTDNRRNIGRIEQLLATARIDHDGMRFAANMDGADTGKIDAVLNVAAATTTTTTTENRALDGHLHISNLRVGLLEAFSWQLQDIGGTLDATLAISGHTNQPLFTGNVGIDQVHFSLTRLPISVLDLNIDGKINGNQLYFSGAFRTPESGEPARMEGSMDLGSTPWHGKATLESNNLVIALLPQYHFTTAPRLQLDIQPEQLLLTGTVRVPSGHIKLKSLPIQSVRRSPDVVIIGENNTRDEKGFTFHQFTDIRLALGNDIHFDAFGGTGLVGGDLRVRSRPGLPLLVNGELHVTEGKYIAFGQSLTLKQADIIFNGPADQPLIDALAVREINDPVVREVGLRLSGSLHAPETVLWSMPELPPQEVVSWLVTGQSISAGPVNLRGEAAQAAFSAGLAQGSVLLSQAGQHIGLENVQLSATNTATNEGEQAEVQVGTRLNKAVYVGYNRRVFTGEESVLLRLQLSRRLMLEALSGLESALDIFYTFEF